MTSSLAPRAETSFSFGGHSPYFATQRARGRQPVLLFDQDTRKMSNLWSRTEMMLLSRLLYAQYGPAMAVDTLFNLVGHLKPQARTGDAKFDAAAEERFEEIACSPLIFDASGEHDFYSFQSAMGVSRAVDGDGFSVFTETTTGSARIAFRESHLVRNPADAPPGWFDGVRINADRFPLSYHFTTPGQDTGRILPAYSVFHHREKRLMGQVRGVTAFAHALNNMRDLLETDSALKQAIKNAAMVALTRAQDVAHGMTPSQFGLGSPTWSEPWIPPGSSTPTTGDEAAALPQVNFEDFIAAGIFSQVPLKVLQDERPSPNQQEFKRDLLRQIAWGLGVPPHFLYFFDEPGGADVRIQVEILAKWIFRQHMVHLKPFCRRFWTYAIAKEMQAGRLPACSGKWWRVRWTPQRSITADHGRMGRLAVDLMQALMTTYAAHYEELGADWEEEIDQIGKERRFIKDTELKYSLDPGELTDALKRPGVASNEPAASTNDTAALAAQLDTLAQKLDALTTSLRPAA